MRAARVIVAVDSSLNGVKVTAAVDSVDGEFESRTADDKLAAGVDVEVGTTAEGTDVKIFVITGIVFPVERIDLRTPFLRGRSVS